MFLLLKKAKIKNFDNESEKFLKTFDLLALKLHNLVDFLVHC